MSESGRRGLGVAAIIIIVAALASASTYWFVSVNQKPVTVTKTVTTASTVTSVRTVTSPVTTTVTRTKTVVNTVTETTTETTTVTKTITTTPKPSVLRDDDAASKLAARLLRSRVALAVMMWFAGVPAHTKGWANSSESVTTATESLLRNALTTFSDMVLVAINTPITKAYNVTAELTPLKLAAPPSTGSGSCVTYRVEDAGFKIKSYLGIVPLNGSAAGLAGAATTTIGFSSVFGGVLNWHEGFMTVVLNITSLSLGKEMNVSEVMRFDDWGLPLHVSVVREGESASITLNSSSGSLIVKEGNKTVVIKDVGRVLVEALMSTRVRTGFVRYVTFPSGLTLPEYRVSLEVNLKTMVNKTLLFLMLRGEGSAYLLGKNVLVMSNLTLSDGRVIIDTNGGPRQCYVLEMAAKEGSRILDINVAG